MLHQIASSVWWYVIRNQCPPPLFRGQEPLTEGSLMDQEIYNQDVLDINKPKKSVTFDLRSGGHRIRKGHLDR